jgi:hypothetical protein
MNNPQTIFLSIAISIGVFLLLREVFCWYFKINKRISLLTDIKDELIQANRYINESKELSGLVLSRSAFAELEVQERKDFVMNRGVITEDASISDKRKESFWRAK